MLTMKKKKFIVILIGLLLTVIPTSVEGQCSQCNDATDCGEDKAEECPEPSVTHCFSIMVEGTTRWGCTDDDYKCKGTADNCKVCDDTDCIEIDTITCTVENDAAQEKTRLCLSEVFCIGTYDEDGNIDTLECSETDCGDDDDCRSCEDSGCPLTIHNCYSCNLSDEGDCSQTVEDTKSINCAKTDVGCLTRIDKSSGKITRKCMTETEETECVDGNICISCKDVEKCNIHETSICEAEGDLVDTVRCLEFNDRCNAFYNDDGKLYKMKCKSEMTEDCTTNDCQDCKGNVCQKEVLRCHACTSLDNELNCVNHLGNIPSSNCAVDELLCFTRLEGDKVTRGCLQDASQCNNRNVCRMCVNQNDCNNDAVTVCSAQNNVREALTDIVCSNFDDECQGIYNTDGELTELKCGSSGTCEDGCEYCEGYECKAKLLSCYTCDDSDEESDCFKEPSQTARKLCSISTTECFTNWQYENGILTRGCLDDASVCKNNADCKTCSDDNCNNLPKDELTKYCKDENDDNQRCSKITDTCHGIYNAAGVLTEAGCKNDLEGECNSNLCRECSPDGCDRELRTCIRCDVDDINCTILPGRFTPIVCQSADSLCYVKQNEEGKNERGCFESGENCNTNCQTCSESNCNDKPFPESRRRCYACDGSRTCDEEMDTTEDDVDSLLKICEKTDDECVTRIIEASRTIRGCKGELDSQAENCPSNTCKVCAENGCNNEFAIKNPDLSCYVCNSTELGCGYTLSKFIIKPRPCRGLVLMGNEEHCYHFKKDVIERGCALELNLSVDEYVDCAAGETCHLCTDNNCNDGAISEASLGVTNALYLVLITSVITYLT